MALGEDTPASQRSGWAFDRREIRKRVGPSNPLYHLFLDLAVASVFAPRELNDHFVLLDTGIWDVDAGSGSTALAISTGAISGQITGQLPNTDNEWIRLQSVAEPFDVDNRPVAMACFKSSEFDSDDHALKFEWGFKANLGDADGAAPDADAGQVATKATPTSNVNDYGVVILDTDDNVFWDVVADDDGTPLTTNVAASLPWNHTSGASDTTAGDDVWQTAMVAMNENQETFGWINGHYIGQVATAPDTTTALGLHFFFQNREAPGGTRDCEIDFIKAWQEREAIS